MSTMASDDDDPVASASAIAAAHQEDVLALMNAPAGATSTGAPQQEALLTLLELFHDTERARRRRQWKRIQRDAGADEEEANNDG